MEQNFYFCTQCDRGFNYPMTFVENDSMIEALCNKCYFKKFGSEEQ